MIKAILAVSKNNAIGSSHTKSGLPWEHGAYPEDMKIFRKKTLESIVVGGNNTFRTFGGCLRDRSNYILSKSISSDGFDLVESSKGTVIFKVGMERLLSWFLAWETVSPKDSIWVIGGKSIYEQLLPQIEEFHISRIADSYPDADVYLDIDSLLEGFTLVDTKVLSDKVAVEIWRKV